MEWYKRNWEMCAVGRSYTIILLRLTLKIEPKTGLAQIVDSPQSLLSKRRTVPYGFIVGSASPGVDAMVNWRPHEDDCKCDARGCRNHYAETHVSKKRTYAICDDHIEDAISAASEDNKMEEKV